MYSFDVTSALNSASNVVTAAMTVWVRVPLATLLSIVNITVVSSPDVVLVTALVVAVPAPSTPAYAVAVVGAPLMKIVLAGQGAHPLLRGGGRGRIRDPASSESRVSKTETAAKILAPKSGSAEGHQILSVRAAQQPRERWSLGT
jgi:hypothetical protein